MIDLIPIFKKFSSGTIIYSTIYGNIKFERISNNSIFPIVCNVFGQSVIFTKFGQFDNNPQGECILFPTINNRSWDNYIYIPIGSIVAYKQSTHSSNWALGLYNGNNEAYVIKDNEKLISKFKIIKLIDSITIKDI